MQVLFGWVNGSASPPKKLGVGIRRRMDHVYFNFKKHKIYLNRRVISPFNTGFVKEYDRFLRYYRVESEGWLRKLLLD